MIDLPVGRQTFDFDCGAKALQLVMAYYGIDVREDELLEELRCNGDGTPVRDMISSAEKRGFTVIAKCGFNVREVKRLVNEQHPVIVVVQAWAKKRMTLEEWRRSNANGHYVVLIEHYGNILVFRDPASFRKTWMTQEEFVARWHDIDSATQQRLDCFGMVLQGKTPSPAHKEMEHMN